MGGKELQDTLFIFLSDFLPFRATPQALNYPTYRSWRIDSSISTLATHDVVTAIDIQRLSRDRGSERRAQERRGVGDFLNFDPPRQRRPLRGVLNHLVDFADGTSSSRCVGPCGNQVDANAFRPQVAG